MKKNNRLIGKQKEQLAADYLKKAGYVILEQNFWCRQGEIDLIAKDVDTLVFIEVKYRFTIKKGYPEEAVTLYKQKKIVDIARYYLYKHEIPENTVVRFDVIAILNDKIRLIKNAFTA